jgi:hypothetical protein
VISFPFLLNCFACLTGIVCQTRQNHIFVMSADTMSWLGPFIKDSVSLCNAGEMAYPPTWIYKMQKPSVFHHNAFAIPLLIYHGLFLNSQII